MTEQPSLRFARQLALAIPAILLGGALISEYVFGLYPCEMCMWQRYPHVAAIALASIAALTDKKRFWIALAGLAILVSGGIGAFHAGVEQGWWEGLTSCASTVSASEGDALDAILNAPIIRCDEIPWSFLGLSLAAWNFVISTLSGLAVLVLLARSKQ